MDFTPFSHPDDAWNAILDYAVSPDFAELDDDTKAAVTNFLKMDSISFCIAYTADWAFARKADLPASFLVLGASCAAYGVQHGVDGLAGARGGGIMLALRRDSGEAAIPGLAWPASDADPEPRIDFVKPAPPQDEQ